MTPNNAHLKHKNIFPYFSYMFRRHMRHFRAALYQNFNLTEMK